MNMSVCSSTDLHAYACLHKSCMQCNVIAVLLRSQVVHVPHHVQSSMFEPNELGEQILKLQIWKLLSSAADNSSAALWAC